MNSTSSLRSSAEKLLDKGARKLASAVASTVKRGAQYQIRGVNMLLDYAMRAGTNSGVGSAVGSVVNPVVNEVISSW